MSDSRLRAEVIAATAKYIPKMCWSNAVEALLTSVHPALYGAVYVEGHAIAPDGHVEAHGWLRLASGDILDLTWPDSGTYFAGVEYSREELARLDPDFLPIVRLVYGRGGFDNPAYEKSYYNAVRAAKNLCPNCSKHPICPSNGVYCWMCIQILALRVRKR